MAQIEHIGTHEHGNEGYPPRMGRIIMNAYSSADSLRLLFDNHTISTLLGGGYLRLRVYGTRSLAIALSAQPPSSRYLITSIRRLARSKSQVYALSSQ